MPDQSAMPSRRARPTAARLAAVLVVTLWTTIVAGASNDPIGASGSNADGTPTPVDIRPSAGPSILERSRFGPTTGEHVDLVGADAWHEAGIDGASTTVGVIDFFDVSRYWNVDEHGSLPIPGVTAACFDDGEDCTADFFDGFDEGGEDHGVAVVETIRDMAPGARILIGQARTIADYRLLIDWFAERDVDVVSRSLGSRYDGPGDGRGPLNDVVDDAVARGMLWVNSAGNNGAGKYYRHQVRLDGNRVAFGPGGSETFLRLTGCVALGGVRWANDWDRPAGDRTDYDVYLWESPTGTPAAGAVVDSSRRRQRLGASPIEHIAATHCPSAGASLYLEVRWLGGDTTGDVLEILDYGSGIASFTSGAGSAAVSVVDSANPGVLAVGAIDPADGRTVAVYSSRGPANDGRVLPDLVAPASLTNTVQGRFAGTSAAAAVVAGASALLLDARLAADPVTTADLVRHLTVDRAPSGVDNSSGHGELVLPDPPASPSASSPTKFVALDVPVRALDTRPETAAGPPDLIGRVGRGDLLDLRIGGVDGVPASGVAAVAVNIVSVEADRPSYVQALPTNAAMLGGYSNINVDAPGQTRANFAIVPLGADGTISLYSIADGHVVVDVLGYFVPSPGAVTGGRFVGLATAERVLDTRTDAPIGPLRSGDVRSAPMPQRIDPDDVAALVLTVTAAGPTSPGWIQAFPRGRPDAVAATSTVNTSTGGAVANTAIVPVTGGGVSVTGFFSANGSSDVIVDVVGYITSASADSSTSGRYVPVVPGRAYDSRLAGGPLADSEAITVAGSSAPGVTIPTTAGGIVWNAAIVHATRPGFARTWSPAAGEPETSSLNWSRAGEVRAGAAISAADGGRSRFRLDDGSANLPGPVGDLIVDVFGYFT